MKVDKHASVHVQYAWVPSWLHAHVFDDPEKCMAFWGLAGGFTC